jgi:cell division protein FtsW
MKVAVTTLAFCVAALLALGLVMIYSASTGLVNARTHTEVGAHLLQMQLDLVSRSASSLRGDGGSRLSLLKKLAWPVFIGALVLAACVFVPHFGMKLNGAHRWIRLPGATFQPSELVKIALIIMLAWYCDRSQRKMDTFKRGIIFPGIIIAAALGLIFIEPDRGTTILLATVSGMMLLVAGVRLETPGCSRIGRRGGSSHFHFARPDAHEPHRRVAAPAATSGRRRASGATGHDRLGSGGVTGLGLGNGLQKLGYVPEIQSDFIFANIGEELGLIATLLVVLAFLLIAISGIFIALNARDNFGCLLAVGVTFLISLQAAINIGVVTSVLPNKGLALPFISSGGSSLLAMLVGVGILLSVARRAPARENSAAEKFPSRSSRLGQPVRREGNMTDPKQKRPSSPSPAAERAGISFRDSPSPEIQKRGCKIALLISPKDVDQQAVKSAQGMEIFTLPAVGFKTGIIFPSPAALEIPVRASRKFSNQRRPAAVLAMGGFTSAPPILAGKISARKRFCTNPTPFPAKPTVFSRVSWTARLSAFPKPPRD